MSLAVEMKGVQQIPGGSFTATGDGTFDYQGRKGLMSMTLPPLGGVDFGRIDMVIVGTTVYQKFPPSFAVALGDRPWVRVDLAELERLAGVEGGTLAQTTTYDPSQALDYLNGIADVVEVGKEQLLGEEVTHYRGSIDLVKAAENAPPERQPALRSIAQLVGAQRVPVDAWIDGDGRLRKSVTSMDLAKFNPPPEAASGPVKLTGTITITVELFDFGTPVEVTPPPANQVTEFAELLEKAGRRR